MNILGLTTRPRGGPLEQHRPPCDPSGSADAMARIVQRCRRRSGGPGLGNATTYHVGWEVGARGEGVKTVCIGWGSLVWDPGVLRCVGDWQTDGPTLPLEFARVSRDGRLTLVLTPGAEPVPTLWCELDYHTGEAAQAALAGREGAALHAIGLWPGYPPRHATGYAEIAQWGADRGFGAVTWTALRPRFDGVDGAGPKDAAAAYLGTLTGDALVRASEYVRRTPDQVRTGFRAALEATFAVT